MDTSRIQCVVTDRSKSCALSDPRPLWHDLYRIWMLAGWFICLSSTASMAREPAVSPQTSASVAVKQDSVPADLKGDPRLDAPVTLALKGAPLAKCAEALTQQTGLRLSVVRPFEQRRVTVLATRRPLRDVMAAIAAVTNLTYRVGEEGMWHDYELFQSQDQQDQERRQMVASVRREERARALQRDALLQAMERVADAGDSDGAVAANLLASLSPAQRRALAERAVDPADVITVGNNSYVHDHLMYTAPFSSLSPRLQDSVSSMLNRPEATIAPGGGFYNVGVKNRADLNKSSVGFVAMGGGVYVGIVDPDGKDVHFASTVLVHRPGLPGIDSDNDMPPEVNEELNKRRLVDLDEMPHSLRRGRKLRFPTTLARTLLTDVLQSIEFQTGIPIVADDFLRSRRTMFSWVLTDQDEYTLDTALNQVARAFGRRCIYKAGVLRMQTITPGLDLRSEPPGELLDRLRERRRLRQGLKLSDYLDIANLPRAQMDILLTSNLPGLPMDEIWLARKQTRILRFYSGLTEDQKTAAESEDGLPTWRMTARQREELHLITEVGLPQASSGPTGSLRPGFYLRRTEMQPGGEQITMLTVSEGRSPRVRSCQMMLRKPRLAPPLQTDPPHQKPR